MKKSRPDSCEMCLAPLAAGRVTVHSGRGKKLTLVENVPASVCPRCGYREFASEVVRRLERGGTRRPPARRPLTVPVLTFPMPP